MPKIILGPMSFTLGAHVAIFLAMFISPKVATAVCLGTTLGFFHDHSFHYCPACRITSGICF